MDSNYQRGLDVILVGGVMKIDLNKAVEVLQACGYECDEIESLRQQLAEKVYLNNQLADFLGDAEQKLADSQKQVTLLRYPLEGASQIITFEGVPYYLLDTYERDEALAATEPK